MVLFARSATPSSKRTPSWGIWLESALLEDVSKRPAAIEVELNPILDTVHAAGAISMPAIAELLVHRARYQQPNADWTSVLKGEMRTPERLVSPTGIIERGQAGR